MSSSKEHKSALEACFASLPKTFDTADGQGKLTLDELHHALRSLGYSQARASIIVHDADTSDGIGRKRVAQEADGDARLDIDEFKSLISRHPSPDLSLSRLTSIGRVIKAGEREMERAHADASAGVRGKKASASRDAKLDSLRDLATEAFPFAVVADSHRISQLIDSYNPEVSSGGGGGGGRPEPRQKLA